MVDLDDYEWLTGDEASQLLSQLQTVEQLASSPTHQLLGKLRKSFPAERASLLVQQLELRRRGVAKFGDLANNLFFTDVGLQQATDFWIARYKASRLTEATRIADYCTGIGGDLLAFAEVGNVRGWDSAAEVAHLANANLRNSSPVFTSQVNVGLAEEQSPDADEVWHLDPDRRTDGRRSTQLQWHSPKPEIVDQWLTSSPNGILKLAPATKVPARWAEQAELEWVSRDRQCRQQIAWFGRQATSSGTRRATVVLKCEDGSVESASFLGAPNEVAAISAEVGKYVYDTDPSIRAADLTGAIASACELQSLETGPSYLTNDQAIEHPLLARFTVLELLPLRVKPLAKHLRSLDIGQLEIKKRGVETDPERLRKELKLDGERAATLLLTRIKTREIAILAEREQG